MTLSAYLIARSTDCKNLSSCDLISKPYVISMINAPVTLGMGEVSLDRYREDAVQGETYNCAWSRKSSGVSARRERKR